MFEDWSGTGDGRPEVVDLRGGALGGLNGFYGLDEGKVLPTVTGHAYHALEAQTAVIEHRYIDPDYRDEHSKFWSTTFRRYPSVAHRLHFLGNPVEEVAQQRPFQFQDVDYLGYVVLRPVRSAPVGRTMLRFSCDEPTLVMCETSDAVNVNGCELAVQGVPFYSQDAQLTRCGQAAIMSTAYYYHRAFGNRRVLPSDVASAIASDDNGEVGRLLPSSGVTLGQLSHAATGMGLPPVIYPVPSLGKSFDETVCRYLNSRFPVTVFTKGHAFVLVGYKRQLRADGTEKVVYLRHDDEVGPYQWVDRDEVDDYGPWLYVIVPLPPKVYLLGEKAEPIGIARLKEALLKGTNLDRRLLERYESTDDLCVRTTAVTSNDFKKSVGDRGLPDAIALEYQQQPMSRYVWVVELTDKRLRDARKPCVLAEVVIDATDHPRDPKELAWRTTSTMARRTIDSANRYHDDDGTGELAYADPIHSVVTHIQPHSLHP